MADYRLYFFDHGGHIGGVVELSGADDAEAIQQSRGQADGRAMELWNRDRLVRAFPADDLRLDSPRRGVDPRTQGLDP